MPFQMTVKMDVSSLKGLREAGGFTVRELSEETGISRSTINRIENGETDPTIKQAGNLITVFGLEDRPFKHIYFLFSENEND